MRIILLKLALIVCSLSVNAQRNMEQLNVQLLQGEYAFDELIIQLSRELSFNFSAEASVFEGPQLFKIESEKQSLKGLLDKACGSFGKEYTWNGNHLHIYNSKKQELKIKREIKGVILDSETGLRLHGVKLKDKISGLSASTNDDGMFRFVLENPMQGLVLYHSKEGYHSGKVKLKSDDDLILRMFLTPSNKPIVDEASMLRIDPIFPEILSKPVDKYPLSVTLDSLPDFYSDPLWRYLISAASKRRMMNDSTLRRSTFQAGLLPGIGTSGKEDSRTLVSGMALDVLIGLNGGVNGLAIAGLANVSRFGANGAQVSGAGNMNGGYVKGLQMSGIYNSAQLGIAGLQMAGVINTSEGKFRGLQLSGIYGSSTGKTDGTQLSGICNRSKGRLIGLQMSGICNVADSLDGMQFSLINRCKSLSGFQFGLVNIADDADDGFQIGLYNYVKNGHRFLSIDIDELSFLKIQYESGGKSFYSAISAGIKENNDLVWWQVGWGIAKIFRAEKAMEYHLRTMVSALNADNWSSDWNLLGSLQLDARLRIYKDLRLVIGPSINTYIPHSNDTGFSTFPDRWNIPELQRVSSKAQFWPGFRLGFGF